MDLRPQTLHQAAENGFKRLRNFRQARLMFINKFAGHYYDKDYGTVGSEPLNYSFNAIKSLVPSLIARHPKIVIETDYLAYRQYSEVLALALNYLSKKAKLPEIMQLALIDSFFCMGIIKVGLCTSGSLAYFGEEPVDPGKIVVSNISFDEFTFDPTAKSLDQPGFVGERIRVERSLVMDSGLFDNAIIEKLPSILDTDPGLQQTARKLSSANFSIQQLESLHDYIDLLEVFLPGPQMIVTMPFKSGDNTKFLRTQSWYGPENGPYIYLSLTPPVPDNPIPIALAGIWHDLHVMANRVGKKTLDQAEAQKDILVYRASAADDAQEIVNAKNLDAVKSDDPEGAKPYSIGGQNPSNERMLAELDVWFNRMAGNPSLIGGVEAPGKFATETAILNQNTQTTMAYMQDKVYDATKEVLRKCAWYLHTDPLIKLPLIRRDFVEAQYRVIGGRIAMTAPARTAETQVFLTPEVRRGDFLDFAFDIEPQSMAPVNWILRSQQLETLAVRVIPAAAQAAVAMSQVGQPFSFKNFIIRWAKFNGFEWIDEIFQDPELIAYSMMLAQMGPQPQKGQTVAATRQNQGAVVGQTAPSQGTQIRQQAQEGAAREQAELPVRE